LPPLLFSVSLPRPKNAYPFLLGSYFFLFI
jgi:hypothetical protein